MNRPSTQRGFVLLMTLVLLALAAVVLVDLSRRSVRRAVQATHAQAELRHRWAAASARAALLTRPEAVLEQAPPSESGAPAIAAARIIHLNGTPHLLRLSNEQAKANLNTLFLHEGRSDAARAAAALTESVPDTGRISLAPDPRASIELSPEAPPPSPGSPQRILQAGPIPLDGSLRPLSSWAQVAPDAVPEAIFGLPADLSRLHALKTAVDPSAANRALTLWGDGRLDLAHASRGAAEAVLQPVIGRAKLQRVLKARAEQPDAAPAAWLDAAELTQEERAAVMPRVAGESACYALLFVSPQGVEWAAIEAPAPAVAGDDDGEGAAYVPEPPRVSRLSWR